jgi:CRP/FNR family transcriptional regulator, cyclic AMP receptor protein
MSPARAGEASDILDYLPHSTLTNYAAGKTIYARGQPANHLFLVVTGSVQVFRTIPGHGSLVIDVYQSDEIFGESALLHQSSRPDIAITLETTDLMMWTIGEIRDAIRSRPQIGISLSELLARRLIDFGNRIESFAADHISRRLALVLIRLSERLGHDDADGSVQITGLGHEVLAEYIFSSRASVTHWLKHFRRKGLLEYRRNCIRILPSALADWLKVETRDIEQSVERKPAAGALASSSPAQTLSRREIQIMDLVAEGLTNKEIGRRLGLSKQTVKNHLLHSFKKLAAVNRRQAARLLAQMKQRARSLPAVASCATALSYSKPSLAQVASTFQAGDEAVTR